MNRDAIRKAVAGVLAFIIGISIAVVTIIPLLIYLNSTSGALLNALNQVRDFQSQKSSESLDVVYEGGSIYLKNTGSVPATIVLAVIDSGKGCSSNTFLLKTSIPISTGDRISSINISSRSYGLTDICYVMTARGNVFPVKEKYLALQAQLSQQAGNILFTPNNTIFPDDASKYTTVGKYSDGDLSCSKKGDVWNNVTFPDYGKNLIAVVDTNLGQQQGIPVTINGKSGCVSITFKQSVNVPQGAYAVVIYYRIIVQSNNDKMNVIIIPSLIKDNKIYMSSDVNAMHSPSSIFKNSYLSFEGYSLIPLKDATPGLYDLNITVAFPDTTGSTAPKVGIEYIAIQGATLVTR